MGLTTLTKTEQRWRNRAREAVERSETWDRCDDCGRFHPAGFQGDCDDLDNRLPRSPAEMLR